MERRNQTGGFLPEQEEYSEDHTLDEEDALRQREEEEEKHNDNEKRKTQSMRLPIRMLELR